MNNSYNINDILYAITNKSTFEDRAASTGNYDWINIVLDAEIILKNAKLTQRQTEIFTLYYRCDYTLAQIGDQLGISHQGVADCLSQCKKKIQKVLDSMEVAAC